MSLDSWLGAKRPAPDSTEDKENEPPSKTVRAHKSTGEEETSSIAEWLNSLDKREAQRLFSIMQDKQGVATNTTLSKATAEELQGLTNVACKERDGAWYAAFCTHRISSVKVGINSKTGNVEHPRWQIDVTAQRSSSVANLLARELRDSSWKALQQLVKGRPARQVKLSCHHVAYNASSKRDSVSLPSNLGSGSSISHLCDTAGCIEPDHLEVSVAHVDNMARQRCNGVELLLVGQVITQEWPCDHGKGKSSHDLIMTSCRRVKIRRVDGNTKAEILFDYLS